MHPTAPVGAQQLAPPPGEVRVVGSLDSQRHQSYRLTVRLTDTHNDVDPAKRRSRLCDVTVLLQVQVEPVG